jgi:hypothetical protein
MFLRGLKKTYMSYMLKRNLFPNTISFFSLLIRLKEAGDVLRVLQKLILKGKKYFLQIYIISTKNYHLTHNVCFFRLNLL